jgi:hypothetical protein
MGRAPSVPPSQSPLRALAVVFSSAACVALKSVLFFLPSSFFQVVHLLCDITSVLFPIPHDHHHEHALPLSLSCSAAALCRVVLCGCVTPVTLALCDSHSHLGPLVPDAPLLDSPLSLTASNPTGAECHGVSEGLGEVRGEVAAGVCFSMGFPVCC